MKNRNQFQRRKFLKKLSVGSLSMLGVHALAQATSWSYLSADLAFFSPDEEGYWEMVKNQFEIDKDLIMMNAANLCPSPHAVANTVNEYVHALNKDVSFQYREVFNQKRKESIEKLANFLGSQDSEIGITSNTSEANCMIAQGLDLKSGDEVIIWDQNHPSNEAIWDLQAKRFGIVVKRVATPINPKSKDELIDVLQNRLLQKQK
ncbi:MAG: aminotransferase class V-fold PLP-dependent enzyme [Flammeovirgaceae bacterium]|nr:aminotransferase class V-fold PLP-dependent enzyme [Flammeovirgaceae bacterium]